MRTSAAVHTPPTPLANRVACPDRTQSAGGNASGKHLAKALAVLLGLLMLVGCGGSANPDGNTAPTVNADSASMGEDDSVLEIDVLANDTDPEGDDLEIFSVDDAAAGGAVTTDGNLLSYDPRGAFDHLAPGDSEDDTFEYTVHDESGMQATGTVTVTVAGADDRASCRDSPLTTLYVDESVSSSGDGSGWDTAYEMVTEGVAAASSGDRVCIAPGEYAEGSQIDLGPNLTLEGAVDVDGPRTDTVLDGENSYPLIHVQDTTATLVNLELRNGLTLGSLTGAGIMSDNTNLTLVDTRVMNNEAYGFGGGIFSGGGDLRLEGSTVVAQNEADDWGGGVYSSGTLYVGSGVEIRDNFTETEGGGLFLDGGSATLVGAAIRGNLAADSGGGISTDFAAITITGKSVIAGNEADDGGGIFLFGDKVVIQNGSQVANNFSNGDGGGVWVSSDGELVLQSTAAVNDNQAAGDGGGIYNVGSTQLASTTEVTSNASGEDGGGVHNSGELTITAGTEVTDNEAGIGRNGGGIFNEGTITGDQSGVTGNDPDDVAP